MIAEARDQSNQVAVKTALDLPNLGPRHRLRRILAASLPKPADGLAPGDGCYWSADHFGLDRSRLFQHASPARQSEILVSCSRSLLEEAFFIEKAGMVFTAKMLLLAPSSEERMLYALFAADEARHLATVSRYLTEPAEAQGNPFLALLSEIIDSGDRVSLIFIIQVVLEGWGLSHYQNLARSCRNPALAASLTGIVRDEARHHGSGALMFKEEPLSPASTEAITAALESFLSMVRCGPQNVVAAVDQSFGGLTRSQRIELFTELNAQAHSNTRLQLLKTLMESPKALPIITRLEGAGCFTPLSPGDCA